MIIITLAYIYFPPLLLHCDILYIVMPGVLLPMSFSLHCKENPQTHVSKTTEFITASTYTASRLFLSQLFSRALDSTELRLNLSFLYTPYSWILGSPNAYQTVTLVTLPVILTAQPCQISLLSFQSGESGGKPHKSPKRFAETPKLQHNNILIPLGYQFVSYELELHPSLN